jgi:hypothetical protein
VGFCLCIIDVGAQGVERHFAVHFLLCAGDFSATQATTNNNFDSFGIGTHGLLHGLFHRAAERDTLLQLLCDTAADQGRIQLRRADFSDIDTHAAHLGL